MVNLTTLVIIINNIISEETRSLTQNRETGCKRGKANKTSVWVIELSGNNSNYLKKNAIINMYTTPKWMIKRKCEEDAE
jgi:hypothetical protein